MQNGEVRLKRIGSELPENTSPADWIENGRMIIACGQVIRRRMVATMFRGWSGKLYLKVEEITNPIEAVMKLAPGVYFDVAKGARITDFVSATLRPGFHDVQSIIRMCRVKQKQGNNDSTWALRKTLLAAISELYRWFDSGVYEINIGKQNFHGNHQTESFKIRRPDFLSGGVTETEKKNLNSFINSWLGRSKRTKPIEPEKLIPAINNLYRCFGLKEPKIVIATSPLVVAIAGSFAAALCYARKNRGQNGYYSQRVFDAVISDEIYQATVETAYRSIEDVIDYQTQKMIEQLIDDASDLSVRRSINGVVGTAIEAAIADATKGRNWTESVLATRDKHNEFESSMVKAVFNATCVAADTVALHDSSKRVGSTFEQVADDLSGGKANVRDLMLSCLDDCRRILQNGNTQQYDECLTTALQEEFGLKLQAREKHAAWQEVATKCSAYLMHEEFCIVSDFPEVLHVDKESRPHCDDGPSYIWKDGWRLYHWHGTRVTKKIVEEPETISVDDIEQEPNLELRRLMLDRYGIKRFLIDSNAREIHRDECGILYCQMVHSSLDPIVMVKVVNATEEPDGTFKDYFLRVPPYISTAKAAVAWTFGLTAEQYCPSVQT